MGTLVKCGTNFKITLWKNGKYRNHLSNHQMLFQPTTLRYGDDYWWFSIHFCPFMFIMAIKNICPFYMLDKSCRRWLRTWYCLKGVWHFCFQFSFSLWLLKTGILELVLWEFCHCFILSVLIFIFCVMLTCFLLFKPCVSYLKLCQRKRMKWGVLWTLDYITFSFFFF